MHKLVVAINNGAEADVVLNALEAYRRAPPLTDTAITPAPETALSLDISGSAERIFQGLGWARLGPGYEKILRTWLDAGAAYTKVDDLAEAVAVSLVQIRSMISKLSGRMKRIATDDEIKNLRTPMLLLVDVHYDEKGSSRHRLTAAGREAVKRYLGR